MVVSNLLCPSVRLSVPDRMLVAAGDVQAALSNLVRDTPLVGVNKTRRSRQRTRGGWYGKTDGLVTDPERGFPQIGVWDEMNRGFVYGF